MTDARDHATDPEQLAALRQDYRTPPLHRAALHPDPVAQLGRWLDEAVAADLPEPNAMALATTDARGRPSVRTVLLKGLDPQGLRFYTGYGSQKGQELAAQPYASACFLWHALHRQVRVSGPVERLDRAASDGYFRSRPRGSQIAAWASPQSRVIADRASLEARYRDAERRFDGTAVPLPDDWGGYLLRPEQVEVWQGKPSRLHDRFRYRRPDAGSGWRIERLAP